MKKKLLSILLCLCMALSLLPTVALAATAGDGTTSESACTTAAELATALGGDSIATASTNTVTMKADISALAATIYIAPASGITLDLNGHSVTGATPNTSQGITPLNIVRGTFTIQNSSNSVAGITGGAGSSSNGGDGVCGNVTVSGTGAVNLIGGAGSTAGKAITGTLTVTSMVVKGGSNANPTEVVTSAYDGYQYLTITRIYGTERSPVTTAVQLAMALNNALSESAEVDGSGNAKLLKDFTDSNVLTSTIRIEPVRSGIMLDLNGHSIVCANTTDLTQNALSPFEVPWFVRDLGTLTIINSNTSTSGSLTGGNHLGYTSSMANFGGKGIIGSATISGIGDIYINGGDSTAGYGGKGISGNATINASGNVIITGGNGLQKVGGNGISGSAIISGSGDVTITAGNGAKESDGVSGSVTVTGTGTVKINAGTGSNSKALDGELSAADMIIKGGNSSEDITNPIVSGTKTDYRYVTVTPPPVISVTIGSTTTEYSNFAAGWNAAATADTATVKLLDNWTAASDADQGTSFGTGAGFSGDIFVPSGKTIILDLNGKAIDRNLDEDAAHSGNGVIWNCGTLTIMDSGTSGTITGSHGNGVLNDGVFTMTGGTISGNKGAGVWDRPSGSMTVGGTASITGNTNGGGTTTRNVYLSDGKTITVNDGFSGSIGVTSAATTYPVAITAASSTDYSGNFFSDSASYGIVNSGSDSAQVVKLALRSTAPAATITTVAKAAATQTRVDFALTNDPLYANSQTWTVYSGSTGDTLATGVAASNVGNTLTLTHASDIPAGTYYVSVTETDKLESARLTLAVSAYVAPSSSGSSSPTYSITNGTTSTANGSVTLDKTNATSGSTVKITPKAKDGYEVDTITVKDANGKTIDVTKNADGTFSFKMPSGKVTVEATFKKIVTETPWVNPFGDVSETDWFYDAVEYANENGLFAGTGTNTFSPSAPMTRAMLWTVLGRLDGQTMTGSDVFDAAKDWATEKGITDGSNPNGEITREQLVTILWRYAGSPAPSGNLDGFSDADGVADYAKQAMAWAVENGIVGGSNGALMPTNPATRAQVAAILMRYAQSAEK